MIDIELLTTADGSHSLYHPVLKETYHSKHGAVQESQHIFINEDLLYFLNQNLTWNQTLQILEIGFGTGLNTLLTVLAQKQLTKPLSIHYTTLEPYPVAHSLVQQLNYPAHLQHPEAQGVFVQLHQAEWNKPVSVNQNFTIEKCEAGVQSFEVKTASQIIYFDAFAPQKQPDMWELSVLERLYNVLSPGGILVTYAAQGQFKRNLKACGFLVESPKGPAYKKEMVRALKPS